MQKSLNFKYKNIVNIRRPNFQIELEDEQK